MADTSEVRICSIARTLDVVGERWTLLAVRELMLGTRRFDDIVARTGAPRDILTTRLRKLVEHGLVARVPYQERPARFEYRLTREGWSLSGIISTLRAWGDEHLAGPDGPPVVFRHSCGEVLRPAVCCEACGAPVDPADLTVVAPAG